MKNYLKLSFFLFTFLVAGCASVKEPSKLPMTIGIIDGGVDSNGTVKKVLSGKDKKIAIILSQNTKNSFEFMKGMQEYWEKRSHSALKMTERDEAIKSSFSPEIYTKNIIHSLNQYFGGVTVVSDISQIPKTTDYIVIVDVFRSYTNGGGFSSYAVSEINTAFYTLDKNLLNIASASVSELNQDEYQGYKVTMKSIDQWKQNLNNIIQNNPENLRFDYDSCIRQALAVKDKSLKTQAMKACEQ